MTHLTFNSGDSYAVPPGKIHPETVRAMRVLLPSGGNLGTVAPQFSAFRVTITRNPGCAAFTVFRGREPIATNVCAWTSSSAADTWASIEGVYLDLADAVPHVMAGGEAPDMPAAVPWLATLILPGALHQTQSDFGWLADFEQCLAATIIST
jgi:hypothetical protein